MECWDSGILENWFAKGCHRFLKSIDKMTVAIKPFPRYPKAHYSIIPTFPHSLRGTGPADRRPVGAKLPIRAFQSLMIP